MTVATLGTETERVLETLTLICCVCSLDSWFWADILDKSFGYNIYIFGRYKRTQGINTELSYNVV